jgi:hypothetical protein
MAAEITDHFYRGEALVFVARAFAVAGDRERAENLVDAIDEVGVRAEALAAVATAVSEAGDHPAAIALAERAVASARAMPQDFTRISGMAASLPAFVTVLARAGEFDRAEEVARESKEWGSGRLWAVLAAMLPPPRAKRALAHALALGGGWAALLPALATVDPGTVRAVVDEFVAVLGPA